VRRKKGEDGKRKKGKGKKRKRRGHLSWRGELPPGSEGGWRPLCILI